MLLIIRTQLNQQHHTSINPEGTEEKKNFLRKWRDIEVNALVFQNTKLGFFQIWLAVLVLEFQANQILGILTLKFLS
ncbi:hypothetical protein V6N13_058410 [Hibiscus sabdariffa]|uniref:Uncharacterized protein n=1 Tax=Hibiscus sabdariffa TaxID=183260 RepID=A0ABR2GGV2_9ROSI